MSKFIKVSFDEPKDPNGTFYVNIEQVCWISKNGSCSKIRLSSGDILSITSPNHDELLSLIGLSSDSSKG